MRKQNVINIMLFFISDFIKFAVNSKAQNVEWMSNATGVLEKNKIINIRSKSHDGYVCHANRVSSVINATRIRFISRAVLARVICSS
jgi:hypothetical protein